MLILTYISDLLILVVMVCMQVSLINFTASLFGAGGIQAFKTMRTLRALRPLRAMSRMQGMRVTIITTTACMHMHGCMNAAAKKGCICLCAAMIILLFLI